MHRLASALAGGRRRGFLAIAALALAYVSLMQASGWAQTSHHALVRALSDGTPVIDRWHWETRDKSYVDGHFYSVKPPALAAVTLPAYAGLDAVGAQRIFDKAAANQRKDGAQWLPQSAYLRNYGYDPARADRVRRDIEENTGMVWALGLVGVVIPAVLLLLLVRALAERLEPGLGTATAVTLGLCSLILPFSTVLFSHLLSTLLGFAAFALLWRERDGPPRIGLVAVAGLLAGLAVTAEYPLAIAGAVVGLYAVSRGDAFRRGMAYAGGVIAGVLPLFAYNLWAFGSVTHFSYAEAVRVQGRTGHDVLGLNDGGFFGIGEPSGRVVVELLFSSKGLLTLTPVIALGAVGAVLLYRRGGRAEALTMGGVALAYLAYNSGYYLPFGGGTPGPRFLVPMLPFLAVPLAIAYRRLPASTLAFAIPSAAAMLLATVTLPLLGNDDVGAWVGTLRDAEFQNTVVSAFGGGHGWAALTPFLVAAAAAVVLAAVATPRLSFDRLDRSVAAAAVAAWAVLAIVLPPALGRHLPAGDTPGAVDLVLVGAGGALLALVLMSLVYRRPAVSRAPEPAPGRWSGRREVVEDDAAPVLAPDR